MMDENCEKAGEVMQAMMKMEKIIIADLKRLIILKNYIYAKRERRKLVF